MARLSTTALTLCMYTKFYSTSWIRLEHSVTKIGGGIVNTPYTWYPEDAGIASWWNLTVKINATGCSARSGTSMSGRGKRESI